jgi:hypothetical protein
LSRTWIAAVCLLASCHEGTRDVHPDAALAPPPTPPPASPSTREATRAEAEAALSHLEQWVKSGATDNANAWAMAHGLVAFGAELKAADGRSAIDAIVGDYAEQKKIGAKEVYAFPLESAAKIPVEPHRDLMVKSLLEAGLPLDHAFKLKEGRKVTLARLLEDAEYAFHVPADEAGYRDFAWSVSAFMMGEKRGRITAETGTIALSKLAEITMSELEKEQGFIGDLMRAGHPERLEKRKQGIYAHTCGGLHFVQAAVLAAMVTKDPALIERARHQLQIVLFRWEAERTIYARALQQEPKYRLVLLVQELKFYGHVLETFGLASAWGVITPDDATRKKLRAITGDLVNTVQALEPAYGQLKEIRAASGQTYYDLIGDGCHAIRGLRKALVAVFAG